MEAVINIVVLKYIFFFRFVHVWFFCFFFFLKFLNPWLPNDVCPEKILNEIQCCLQLLLVQFFSLCVSLLFNLPECFYF